MVNRKHSCVESPPPGPLQSLYEGGVRRKILSYLFDEIWCILGMSLGIVTRIILAHVLKVEHW